MKCIVMANGDYGDLAFYKEFISGEEQVLCADGGANYAYQMGLIPKMIIGDMDSILPAVKQHYTEQEVTFKKFPRRKDFTDTQLVLTNACEMGASEVILLGSLGKRLDHTMSNLYCALDLVRQGLKITYLSHAGFIYLVNKEIEIVGEIGDMISVLSLTDEARGVTTVGLEFPLDHVVLEKRNPYAISNSLIEKHGMISLEEGVLAVFHYINSPPE